jgi:hypothetical protein
MELWNVESISGEGVRRIRGTRARQPNADSYECCRPSASFTSVLDTVSYESGVLRNMSFQATFGCKSTLKIENLCFPMPLGRKHVFGVIQPP